jgi:hypothetical protein
MRRSRWLIPLPLLVLVASPWRAEGQWNAGGKSVMLQIKPRMGDTLRMRLDQETEMTGVKQSGSSEATASIVSTMKMFSRAIVEQSSGNGTMVLAVTDSVILSSTDEHALLSTQLLERELRGQRVRFRVFPDGTLEMSDTPQPAPREVSEVASLMPAAFPKGPVAVGESWIREMPLPVNTQFGAPLSGKLHMTFRLDSVGRGGAMAFVSMRGEMVPIPALPAPSSTVLERGSVDGTMSVDRRRGWLTESRFNIFVRSTITPLVRGTPVMRMQVRVTQHMQTMDRR